MPRRKFNSRLLRQLAKELVREMAVDSEIPADKRQDLVTSLVRQWITYDGHATVFLGQEQMYLVLGKTPFGEPYIVPEPPLYGRVNRLREDWKISSDELPDIIDQLNRGQGAEVINSDGVPLRLWVNPKERSKGVEPLVKEDIPSGSKRDYRKIAADLLELELGPDLEGEEMEALACSVAKQWQQYDGHAGLFLGDQEQFQLKLTEKDDGGCDVATRMLSVNLEPALSPTACRLKSTRK